MRISDWSSDVCSADLGLRTRAGWSDKFDAIASNADIMHSYRDLLSHTVRGRRQTEILERKRWSPSLFLVHFGIKGTWPGLPHHMMLFGPRYKGLLKDIYQHGVLRSEEHTSELQSLMRISYAVFCLKKKKKK